MNSPRLALMLLRQPIKNLFRDIHATVIVQARCAFGTSAQISDDTRGTGGSHQTENSVPEIPRGFKVDLTKTRKDKPDPDWWAEQKDAKWWHPDPVTGVWVPEDKFGEVASNLPTEARPRDWPRASMDERAWWTSLEEMSDDYNRPTLSRR